MNELVKATTFELVPEPPKLTLLPCPFCGEVPTIEKNTEINVGNCFSDHIRIATETGYRMVHECPVMGPFTTEWIDDPTKISTRWNTRHEQKAITYAE